MACWRSGAGSLVRYEEGAKFRVALREFHAALMRELPRTIIVR